MQTHIIMRI